MNKFEIFSAIILREKNLQRTGQPVHLCELIEVIEQTEYIGEHFDPNLTVAENVELHFKQDENEGN